MSHPIVAPTTYYLVFASLMVLTLVTVGIAYLDLGPLNNILALTIAVVKALLVILYFMHVRYGSRLTWLFIGAGVFWLVLLIAFTLSDVLTRGWLPVPAGWTAAACSSPGEKREAWVALDNGGRRCGVYARYGSADRLPVLLTFS
jgi:cytochrome c oxidase subunit 4